MALALRKANDLPKSRVVRWKGIGHGWAKRGAAHTDTDRIPATHTLLKGVPVFRVYEPLYSMSDKMALHIRPSSECPGE